MIDIDGPSGPSMTNNIMKKFISKQLASKYTLEGRSDPEFTFVNLKLYQCIKCKCKQA